MISSAALCERPDAGGTPDDRWHAKLAQSAGHWVETRGDPYAQSYDVQERKPSRRHCETNERKRLTRPSTVRWLKLAKVTMLQPPVNLNAEKATVESACSSSDMFHV